MIVYHGTTSRSAERICEVGFVPRKPSRRVWFAKSKGYARGRAKVKARRARCRPVILTCDINLNQLREKLGSKRVFASNGIIAVDGPVPVTVLRSHPSLEQPSSPEDLALWVNTLLELKPHKGAGPRHPGIQRLSRWVVNRLASRPRCKVSENELLEMGTRWLPELFQGVEIDRERLAVHRDMPTIDVEVRDEPPQRDPRENEALECLTAATARRRVRGLSLLAQVDVDDLFDWCVMLLEDDSREVQAAALRTMLRCEDGDPEPIAPFAAAEDKRVRGAAIAALAKHAGMDGLRWFERGLKDPSPCVRLQTAQVLEVLDPRQHRAIFELALYDPNPQIERLARKLTAGKGFSKPRW